MIMFIRYVSTKPDNLTASRIALIKLTNGYCYKFE